MKILFKLLAGFIILLLVASCAHIKLDDSAKEVKILFSSVEKTNCSYIGEVVGSDGNMLTFLFMSNRKLTEGALNDIRNNARVMGGNTVFVILNALPYSTSTTFTGSVYNCVK